MPTKKIIQLLVPIVLLGLGLYFMPIKIMGTDFSKVPGDFGDARFNNYILEHGYQYLTGKVTKYWDAPFLYPYKNAIAFSDNLLGTVPIYSVFRLLGNDRETAFQFWLLTLFALNFICCLWALNKWSGNIVLSAIGAYVFAFSIFNIGLLNHAQNFPRFIIPLVFYWMWKYLSQKEVKYFLFMLLGTVFQFYCGIYLGFFLVYGLMFLFISYFVIYRDWKFFLQFKSIKAIVYHLGVLLLSYILLIILMKPYMEVSDKFGMRNFQDGFGTIPTLRSYFFTGKSSIMWGVLSDHGIKLPSFWNHFLFVGALPWIGIVIVPIVLLWKHTESLQKKLIAFISLSFVLSFIFCLNINGFTLYKYIFDLPGFSAMRAINRVINTEAMFFVLIFVFIMKELMNKSVTVKYAIYNLPLLIVIDNLIDPTEVARYDKKESQQLIESVKINITNQYDKKHAAIAYMAENVTGEDPIKMQLNVMLASQELNIPCVNAYSGFFPGEFGDFFDRTDERALLKWLNYNHADKTQIQNINELNKKEIGRLCVYIKAPNNKYVCDGDEVKHVLVADRNKAGNWETFTLILFENNECAIRSYTNKFLTAELSSWTEITANRTAFGGWETFTLTNLPDGYVALKAANGKYLSLDTKYPDIYAGGNVIGVNEKFKIETAKE
ncbi:MAG: fascin domain-containing protein [Bacteroidia bacterium]